jgi:RNA polymerase sigma-70 factor (ECF subfamily)
MNDSFFSTGSLMAPESHSVERAQAINHWITAARSGDTAAFADLVAVLQPDVLRWALSFARDAEEAEEIVQETFILVHRKLRQYKGHSAIEAWVYLITRNVALGRRRKSKRRQWLTESTIPGLDAVYMTDPGARIDRERVAAYIRHFFVTLPPRQREVFDLVDLQGHDPAEVANLIGSKPGAVRANLFKARASIREHLLESHPSWKEIDR